MEAFNLVGGTLTLIKPAMQNLMVLVIFYFLVGDLINQPRLVLSRGIYEE